MPNDDVQAAIRNRKAAKAGDSLAMVNLVVLYEQGRGLSEDVSETLRWFRKAADSGDAACVYGRR